MVEPIGNRSATLRGIDLKEHSGSGAFKASLERARARRTQDTYCPGNYASLGLSGLTRQDIQALAEKYDPEDMTQEEYASFIDELVDKGVFTQRDKNFLGYSESVDVTIDGEEMAGNPTWVGPVGTEPIRFLADAGGNVLKWAQHTSSWFVIGESTGKVKSFNAYKIPLFQKMLPILDAMRMS